MFFPFFMIIYWTLFINLFLFIILKQYTLCHVWKWVEWTEYFKEVYLYADDAVIIGGRFVKMVLDFSHFCIALKPSQCVLKSKFVISLLLDAIKIVCCQTLPLTVTSEKQTLNFCLGKRKVKEKVHLRAGFHCQKLVFLVWTTHQLSSVSPDEGDRMSNWWWRNVRTTREERVNFKHPCIYCMIHWLHFIRWITSNIKNHKEVLFFFQFMFD